MSSSSSEETDTSTSEASSSTSSGNVSVRTRFSSRFFKDGSSPPTGESPTGHSSSASSPEDIADTEPFGAAAAAFDSLRSIRTASINSSSLISNAISGETAGSSSESPKPSAPSANGFGYSSSASPVPSRASAPTSWSSSFEKRSTPGATPETFFA